MRDFRGIKKRGKDLIRGVGRLGKFEKSNLGSEKGVSNWLSID